MASGPLRAVIFDIGRVLVKVDVARSTVGLAENRSLSAAEVWSMLEKDPRWKDWQEGRVTPHEWHRHVSSRLGSLPSFAEFRDAWNRCLDPQPLQTNDLFEAVAKRHKMALLSNTDPMHVAHLESTYDFFQYFPPVARIYSCSIRASKPSPVIFQAALRAVKTPAAEAVFIDDILEFVAAARSLGLRGIHYHSPAQLRDDLKALDPSLQL
jgi:putative hydrolase of the HAD superfamily